MASIRKCPWTLQEDRLLVELVEIFGLKRWTRIAQELNRMTLSPNRNMHQCRNRYFYHLAPGVKKGGWPFEEKRAIFRLHQ